MRRLRSPGRALLLLLVITGSSWAGTKDGPITWIADDYDAALAESKRTKRPLVIDLWAPWCHTCLSMKHYVFNQPPMSEVAERFVWLALDTDKPVNATAIAKFPPDAWPTFYVTDGSESVHARHVGAASLKTFKAFLDRGAKSALGSRADLPPDSPLARLRDADRLATGGHYLKASKAYAELLSVAPATWTFAPDAWLGRIRALYRAKRWSSCAEVALAGLAAIAKTPIVAVSDFSVYGYMCAKKLEEKEKDLALNVWSAVVSPDKASLATVINNPQNTLAPDDRSDAMATLRRALLALGKSEEAKAMAEQQRQLIDQAVAKATPGEMQLTWAWPRLEVYHFLKRQSELISWFQSLEEALPEAYDPPYRMATALLWDKRYKEAMVAAKRALSRVYGRRKARVLGLMAQIYQGLGERQAQLETLAAIVAHHRSLPPSTRREADIEQAQRKLEEAHTSKGE